MSALTTSLIVFAVVVAGVLVGATLQKVARDDRRLPCLYTPRNGTVLAVALLCALSVAGAIFLILEMYEPFGGLIKISDVPIRTAINYLSQWR
jgi:hypothetical protein